MTSRAEIQDLGDVVQAAAIGSHQVGRLDVAMNEPGLVCLMQRITRLSEQVNHACRGHRPESLDDLGQAKAGKILHDVIERAVDVASKIEDLDGIPVRELGRRANLALEAGEDAMVADQVVADQLDRTGAFEQLMFGQIDLAHAAAAQSSTQTVLVQEAGAVGLDSQSIDRVRAKDRRERTQNQEKTVLAHVLETGRLDRVT